jgi:hypothetical protein
LAFCVKEPSVLFISFAIFETGVLAFEYCAGKGADIHIDLLPAWEPDRTMSDKAIKRAVSAAAGPIAVHIDNMLSDLPAWAPALKRSQASSLLNSEFGHAIQSSFDF